MKKIFKKLFRTRMLYDILNEDAEMKSVGKDTPEELIKPYDHMNYYDGMDGPVPPAMIMDIRKDK